MKIIYILCLGMVFFLLGCQSNTKQLEDEVLKWVGKKIIFPTYNETVTFGNDTFSVGERHKFRILSYVDSIGCSSCKLKLSDWNSFIMELNSKYKDQIDYLFYFHPKKTDNIYDLMWKNKFFHAIYVDANDSLNILNHFPEDERFHTFLLNENDEILVVGNPIANPYIKDLYLNIIYGDNIQSAVVSSLEETRISFSSLYLDMGIFNWKQMRSGSFFISNIGEKPLVINEVVVSCGCMIVNYEKQPVLKGDSIKMKIDYNAEHPGYFEKTITIYCNAEGSPFKLKIKGEAR